MSKLSENFGRRFVVTGEIAPPRGHDLTSFNHEVEFFKPLMEKLYAVNVVDIPGSLLLMSSLGASILLQQNRLEPVFQMVCRDRNVLALEADLISAAAFGIENVLALTGDHPKVKSSDHKDAMPVFDLDSSRLIKVVKGMNDGVDINGRKLNMKTSFFLGAALAPGVNPIEPEIYKTRRKLFAGVDFFQTQAVFEPELMESFFRGYERVFKEDVRKKVLMSVVPLYSYDMVRFLKTMPGIVISDKTGKRIKQAKDPLKAGVDIAVEVVEKARDMNVAGVHVMPAGKTEALVEILNRI